MKRRKSPGFAMSFNDIILNIRERAEILKSQGMNAQKTTEDPKAKVAAMQTQGERIPLNKIVQNSPTKQQPPLPRRPVCSMCNGQHEPLKCPSFLRMTRDARVNKIVEKKLCFRCLSNEHISKFCPLPRPRCGTCQGPHQTVLHYDEGEYTPATQAYTPAFGQQGNYHQGRQNYNGNNNGNYRQAGATQSTSQATTTGATTTATPTAPPIMPSTSTATTTPTQAASQA